MSSGSNEQDLTPDPDFRPQDVRLIGDVESLRAISDPTRIRILETMVQRQDPPWSVKELAAEIGVPQTRLYHHVEQLLERDLIRAVERRIVSGIIETRYRVAALSFQLDRGLLAGDSEAGRQALHDTLAAVFDSARGEVEQAIREGVIDMTAGAPDERRVTLSRGLARLSPARAAEFRTRLQALYEEFGDDADPDDRAYGFVFALYPMPRPSGVEATDTDDEATEGATR
ncbi:MAG TPA: helix-turn-helix domain-containing protein [Candidatus Limnocylindrales bacterium]